MAAREGTLTRQCAVETVPLHFGREGVPLSAGESLYCGRCSISRFCVLQADMGRCCKHFAPKFPETGDAQVDSSLTKASELNMAFVFRKTGDSKAVAQSAAAVARSSGVFWIWWWHVSLQDNCISPCGEVELESAGQIDCQQSGWWICKSTRGRRISTFPATSGYNFYHDLRLWHLAVAVESCVLM